MIVLGDSEKAPVCLILPCRYAHQHLAHIVERHPHTLRALEAKPGLLVALLQHSVQRIGGRGGGGAVLSLGASQGQGV